MRPAEDGRENVIWVLIMNASDLIFIPSAAVHSPTVSLRQKTAAGAGMSIPASATASSMLTCTPAAKPGDSLERNIHNL